MKISLQLQPVAIARGLALAIALLFALPTTSSHAQPPGGGDDKRGEGDRGGDDNGGGRGDWRGRGEGRGGDRGGEGRGGEGGRGGWRGGEGRGGEGGRGEGRGGWGGGGGGQSDEERRAGFVRQLDRNGDGKIERGEVDDRMWGFFERGAKESGLDLSKPISIDSYLSARKTSDQQKERAENPTAFLPGPGATKAPGFDVALSELELIMLNPDKVRPVEMTSAPAAKPSTPGPGPGQRPSFGGGPGQWGGGQEEKSEESTPETAKAAVNETIKKYDKNGDNAIDQTEWKEMRGRPERYDLNKDGRITSDEMGGGGGGPGAGGPGPGRSRGGWGKKPDAAGEPSAEKSGETTATRKTYRFSSALERLPSDARSFIEGKDENQDGQVSMSEYSSTWTDSKIREFEKYDLNGDGIITGDEYLDSK